MFSSGGHYIGGWGRWAWNGNPNELPIGKLKVEVRLTDGTDVTYTAVIPAPGSQAADGYTTMYSQDYSGIPPATSAPMVGRASISSGIATGSTVTLSFSVNDQKVYDGYVWFYDSSQKYIGISNEDFVDPSTGQATTQLEGAVLHTDGTANTLTLGSSDIDFISGASVG